MKYLLFIVCCLLFTSISMCQGDEALDRLAAYDLESRLAITDYLVVQNIDVGTANDADIILQANAQIISFKHKNVSYGKFFTNPIFLDGQPEPIDLGVKSPYGDKVFARPHTGAFSSLNSDFEYINVDKSKYLVDTSDGTLNLTNIKADVLHGSALQPFEPMDWPLINPLYTIRFGPFKDGVVKCLMDMKCTSSEVSNGITTGVWETKKLTGYQGGYVCTISFDEDRIIKSKWEVLNYTDNKRDLLSEVKTKWGKKNGEWTPIEVTALMNGPGKSYGQLLSSVKLNWFFPKDKEFEIVKEDIFKISDQIKSRIKKREIAGAE